MTKLKLQDLSLQGKRVLMRVDFNVPQDKGGNITDDTRIKEAIPSVEFVLTHGGSVILMSHLGRPKGKIDPVFTLEPIVKRLSTLLKKPVSFARDMEQAKELSKKLSSGEVLLLENLRFNPAEESPEKDPSFAEELASLGDLYVNDAFGTAHREHSSTATIAKSFPGKAAAGLLMQKEIAFLSQLTTSPKKPFYAIIGGAKVSSKIGVLKSLITKIDGVFIGGGMAYTFLKAQGIEIGNSLFEETSLDEAREFINKCAQKGITIWLPQDVAIGKEFKEDTESQIVKTSAGIPPGWQGLDIGPETLKEWEAVLQTSATVFWNGPLGVFEFPRFAQGTNGIAKTLSQLPNATTVVGGGDSVSAINALGISNKFSHVSTGGGASLEFLEFGQLPGINTLSEAV